MASHGPASYSASLTACQVLPTNAQPLDLSGVLRSCDIRFNLGCTPPSAEYQIIQTPNDTPIK
eukprot:5996147-Amphidinium_carterae.1